MITARGLVHAYGERRAVDGVDLGLVPGERVALAGPNGAGKSTLLRLLATLQRAQSGSLEVLGEKIPGGTRAARAGIGYLAHDPLVYLDLTARQNLELYGDLYGIDHRDARIDELLDRVGLLGRAEDTVRTFSRGMAQRLALARMLLHRPRLLLLDEPHASLDARGAALLDDELGLATADGRAAIIVTHEVERAVRVADRLVVLRAGRVVLDEPTAGLDPLAVRRRYEEAAA
ncbi:MAG: heme ABC exporter ATP-binding protein CcmA [Actinomycetota bacterium]